ncbi:DUF2274 domain-containing protein [Acetobacter fabarum]|uniref:DUF2274 domain-containing protein n=2 Tax=Acetobacter TaxID=434 RepID=A0A841QHP6_9PROT|nr:DUF2274 domain-containing protein [Acetobacter lovaniensis]MBB6458091.1 hypothetical protein [Acetobacter lovaniensis]NHN82369.1 DUF2274 domain-containing protein [Acetobacter lovaniensis]
MTTLRITEIPDDRPVRVTVQLPADLHRDLLAYAAMVRDNGRPADPIKLLPHMIRAFIGSDRVFQKARRDRTVSGVTVPDGHLPAR